MRLIILFLLLFSFSFAKTVVNIPPNTSKITDFKIGFVTNTQKLEFKELKKLKFTQGKNKDSLGAQIANSWVKIDLFNDSNKTQKLFLHQSTAYLTTYIKYFETDINNTLLKTQTIDLSDDFVRNKLDGSHTIYKFLLKPFEYKTIYIFQETHAYHYYDFSILNEKESRQYLVYDKIDGVLIIGLMLSLALYNLFIYISSKYKEYLYYSLYLIFSANWIFFSYGSLAHYFHIYGELPTRFNFALMFSSIFLTLFIQTIFNTKKDYKKEHYFLNSVLFILSINFIYGLIDFNHSLQLLSLVLPYAIFVFLGISISIYKKGNKIVKIFLFAHIFYIIFNIYAILFYTGNIGFTYLSSHGIAIGIILEALFLSYLVSYKFKVMEEEKKRSQLLLFQKAKMADMGEMIANIAHQWRQPLSIVNISSGILREKKALNKLSDQDFEEELNHIDLNISHMSQTIEDFLTYFKPDKQKEHFYILDAVKKALLIIENTIYKEQISVEIDIDKNHKTFAYKKEYIQVLISIISNAISVLKDKEKKNIKINSYKHNDLITLEIQDNGGGIKKEFLEKIFEPYFSTKNKTLGTGLGLYISKNIIENSMNGSLIASNTKDGAKFTIRI